MASSYLVVPPLGNLHEYFIQILSPKRKKCYRTQMLITMINFLTLFSLKQYAHFRKRFFDVTVLINFVNYMIIKNKQTLLIIISQVSQYFNQIFYLRSFLIKTREIFSYIPAKEKDDKQKRVVLIKLRTGFSNYSCRGCGQKIAYWASLSMTPLKTPWRSRGLEALVIDRINVTS